MNTPQQRLHNRSAAAGPRYVAKAAALLLAALMSVVALAPASAHSQLINSEPAAGAVLNRVPGEISLVFNEEVEPRFAAVTIAVAAGDPVQVPNQVQGSRVVVDVPKTSAAASSPIDGAADWQVAYRVVSGDGHPISGTVEFTVTAPAPATAATTAAPTSSDPTPSGEQPTIADPGQEDPGQAAPAAREPATSDTGSEGLSLGQLLGIAALAVVALGGGVWLVARVRRGRTS